MTLPTLLDDLVVEFWVPGTPIPQGSKRIGRHGKYPVILDDNDKVLRPWRKTVAAAATFAMQGREPLDCAVCMSLNFVMPRPKSTPKRRTPKAIRKPDLDKLERSVLDAVTGICVSDDSRVVSLIASKRLAEIGEMPGVHIGLEVEP